MSADAKALLDTVFVVNLPEAVWADTRDGTVTAVIGRPASGVSTLLSHVASSASSSEQVPLTVLAAWERPPDRIGTELHGVVVPYIVAWDLDDLDRCSDLEDAPAGSVVAIDYLQLIGSPTETAARLAGLARQRRWRVILGVMATRNLVELGRELRGAPAVRAATRAHPDLATVASRLVVLSSGAHPAATLASRTPAGRWRVETTVHR